MSVAEKRDTKLNPNMAMPGVRRSTGKTSTGTFAWMAVRSSNRAMGNPRPKAMLMGSRRISFVLRTEKLPIMPPPFLKPNG